MRIKDIKRGVKMNLEDYNEYYIQGSDHYLIPRDIFNEILSKYKVIIGDDK